MMMIFPSFFPQKILLFKRCAHPAGPRLESESWRSWWRWWWWWWWWRRYTPNWPKSSLGGAQNGPKMEPKSIKRRSNAQSCFQMAPETTWFRSPRRFWIIFGFPPESKNWPKIDSMPKREPQGQHFCRFLLRMPVFPLFSWIFNRFSMKFRLKK